MKPGDAVELSTNSRRLKSGNWQVRQKEYKFGTVIEVNTTRCSDYQLVDVLWNNGTLQAERRVDIRHIKDSM